MLCIEYQIGVDVLPVYTELEVQVFCSSPPRTSCEPNGLTSADGVATLYQVLGLMAIHTLQPVGMADNDEVAISGIGFGKAHYPIEHATDGVVGSGLDIVPAMASATGAVLGDDLTTR